MANGRFNDGLRFTEHQFATRLSFEMAISLFSFFLSGMPISYGSVLN